MNQEKKDQLLVVIGASLFQLALVGMLINTSGSIFSVVRADLGFSMTRISAFHMIRYLVGAVSAAALTRLFFRYSMPKVLYVSVFLVCAGFLLVVIGPETVLWFIAPVLLLPTGSLAFFAIPYLVKPWFPDRYGTMSGIAMASSGIGGILYNPLLTWMMERMGWRPAVLITCLATLILGSLGVWLVFRKPAPAAPLPEVKKKEEKAVPGRQPFPLVRFVILTLVLFGMTVCMNFINYLSLYAVSHDYTLMQGAVVLSFSMAGNVLGKLVCGALSDLVGAWWATAICTIGVALGMCLLVLGIGFYPVLLAGALLLGITHGLISMTLARCSIASYGAVRSEDFVGLHSGINCAVAAAAVFAIGWFFDAGGQFDPMMWFGAAAAVLSALLAVLMALSKKQFG